MGLRTCRVELIGLLLLVSSAAGCGGGPVTAGDFNLLALRESSAKNFAVALQYCDQAILLEPDNCDCYNVRAVVYAAMGKKRESTNDWKKAIELAPDQEVRDRMIAELERATQGEAAATETVVVEAKQSDAVARDETP